MNHGVESLRDIVRDAVRGEHSGLILFGSEARGDAHQESDIDVLQIVATHRAPYRDGAVHVSPYTETELLQMAARGSLFVRHVLYEGIALDEGGKKTIERVRAAFVAPVDHAGLLAEVRSAARLLHVTREQYFDLWRRLHMLVLHLLRTTVYALAQDKGVRTFAMARLMGWLADPRVARALALRRGRGADLAGYSDACRLLAEYCGAVIENPYGSIEALIVNAYGTSELTVVLGLRLLSEEGVVLPYEELSAAAGVAV